MKRILTLWALIAFSSAALAQTPSQPIAPDASQSLIEDWQIFVGTQRHVAQSISAIVQENQALKAENAQLKEQLEKASKASPVK